MAIDVPDDFRSFLRTEEMRARDTTLDEARAVAIKAYNGERYGDEEEGRSQAVTRDVSEVVDKMLVDTLQALTAGGKAVEFDTEPEEVPDEQAQPVEGGEQPMRKVDYGAEATAAVHYQFMRKQKGYRILHDAGKAGMLEKTGIVKTYVEPRRPLIEEAEVPQMAIEEIDGEYWLEGLRVVEAVPIDEFEAVLDPVSATMRVSVERPQPPVIRDVNVPNEWFAVSPDTVDLDEAAYVGDRMPVTISAMVEMGYDYDELLTIWSGAEASTIVDQARDGERGQTRQSVGPRTNAQRMLWLNTEYPLYDLNGDGVAERLFVHRIGQHVLNVMEVDEQPYSGWTPIPMQHRFTGQSVFDKIGFIQRLRTVLLRQGLDSIYQTTAPRTTVNVDGMTEDTIDDLLTVRPGAIIRYKGTMPPMPLQGQDSSGTSFQAMEMMSAEREAITGITRQSQGMNPDTTNKTAAGMAMLQANADEIKLYVTRNMAEMLVAPMFAKRYRLMRQHMQPFKMKIEGKYTLIDPSKWPEDPDMQINVGLGTGSREQRIAYRRELMGYQAQAMGSGLRIVTDQQAYNSLKGFIDDTALGVASDFVIDPATLGEVPEQPDPALIEAQGKAQTEMQKLAGEQQLKSYHAATDRQVRLAGVDADAAIKREATEADLQLKRERADAEAQLAVRRQNFDMDLAERRFQFEQTMAQARGVVETQGTGLPAYRPGGELDQ